MRGSIRAWTATSVRIGVIPPLTDVARGNRAFTLFARAFARSGSVAPHRTARTCGRGTRLPYAGTARPWGRHQDILGGFWDRLRSRYNRTRCDEEVLGECETESDGDNRQTEEERLCSLGSHRCDRFLPLLVVQVRISAHQAHDPHEEGRSTSLYF